MYQLPIDLRAQDHDDKAIPLIADILESYYGLSVYQHLRVEKDPLCPALYKSDTTLAEFLKGRPDLSVVDPDTDKCWACEVKSSKKGSPNYSMELLAYSRLLPWADTVPTWVAFADLETDERHAIWARDIPTSPVAYLPRPHDEIDADWLARADAVKAKYP